MAETAGAAPAAAATTPASLPQGVRLALDLEKSLRGARLPSGGYRRAAAGLLLHAPPGTQKLLPVLVVAPGARTWLFPHG